MTEEVGDGVGIVAGFFAEMCSGVTEGGDCDVGGIDAGSAEVFLRS